MGDVGILGNWSEDPTSAYRQAIVAPFIDMTDRRLLGRKHSDPW